MPVPWKSKLNPYENEILRMWKNRKTLPEIQVYLEEKEIEISKQSIWKFIKVRTKKRNPHDIMLSDEEPEPIEKNVFQKTSRHIPEKPTPIVPYKTTTEENNDIETAKEKEMNRLREELKRKAHADPMEGVFIRKKKSNR